MKRKKRWGILAAALCAAQLAGCAQAGRRSSDRSDPVSVVLWTYYKGKQMDTLESLVSDFNATVGAEQGIVVTSETKSSVSELTDALKASRAKAVGSSELPDLFVAYADGAADYVDLLVDLRDYFTEAELAEYVDDFLKQGEMGDGGLYLLPVAKSTELLYLNETDWAVFAEETGAELTQLATWEGLAQVAEQYYDWSGGKAFFGRDAAANYMVVGAAQLGCELFEEAEDGSTVLAPDDEVLHRLWENFAVPYIWGYYGAYGKFRTDDVKTGDLIACIGSTSSISYYPSEVTREDGSAYPIQGGVYVLPNFEGTEPYAVQQGGGMAVMQSDEETQQAAVEFLKWFTEAEQNTVFAAETGYFPVKEEANTKENMEAALKSLSVEESGIVYENAIRGMEQINSSTLCMQPSFVSLSARNTLEKCMETRLNEYKEAFADIPEAERDAWLEEMFQDWVKELRENM